jgi:hypothetical protein
MPCLIILHSMKSVTLVQQGCSVHKFLIESLGKRFALCQFFYAHISQIRCSFGWFLSQLSEKLNLKMLKIKKIIQFKQYFPILLHQDPKRFKPKYKLKIGTYMLIYINQVNIFSICFVSLGHSKIFLTVSWGFVDEIELFFLTRKVEIWNFQSHYITEWRLDIYLRCYFIFGKFFYFLKVHMPSNFSQSWKRQFTLSTDNISKRRKRRFKR